MKVDIVDMVMNIIADTIVIISKVTDIVGIKTTAGKCKHADISKMVHIF